MPLRIADYVRAGDLRNTRRNSVFGWIEFAPDYGVRIELTGNLSGQLAGRHIRFSMPNRDPSKACEPGDFPNHIEDLSDRQIGVVQTMDVRRTSVPALPIDEFLQLSEADRARNMVEKDCLYLEWSSQDGLVVSELIEPVIDYIDDETEDRQLQNMDAADLLAAALEDPDFSNVAEMLLGQTIAAIDANQDEDEGDIDTIGPEEDESEIDADDMDDDDDDLGGHDEDDPYGLFDSELERSVSQSLAGPSLDGMADDDEDDDDDEPMIEVEGDIPPRWEDIIPGIGAEEAELFEKYDEIFEGKKDEPISYLFPTPLQLPKPEHVASEEEAEKLVKAVLSQLALLSVALDVCEHFTMRQTYRLLAQEILPTAKVHPNLAASDMVQHYSTSDYCQECDDEFEANYRAEHGDHEDEDDDEFDDEDEFDEDEFDDLGEEE